MFILLKMPTITFLKCSKYTTFRDVLCQTIQNIIDYDHNFDLDLLVILYGSPDHGFTTNTQIFEAVHTHTHTHIYIYCSYKTLYLNTVMHVTLSIFPHRYYIEFSPSLFLFLSYEIYIISIILILCVFTFTLLLGEG